MHRSDLSDTLHSGSQRPEGSAANKLVIKKQKTSSTIRQVVLQFVNVRGLLSGGNRLNEKLAKEVQENCKV